MQTKSCKSHNKFTRGRIFAALAAAGYVVLPGQIAGAALPLVIRRGAS